MKRFLLFISIFLASVVNLPAPDVRVTGLGNTNYFPVWRNGNSVTTNSQIYQLGTLIGIGTTNPAAKVQISETNTVEPRGLVNAQYSTGTNGSWMTYRKARGTELVPTTLVTGDNIARINFDGYDGANYLNMAGIEVSATGTVATNRIPTEMRFYTATDALPSVKTLRLTINNAGVSTFASSVTLSAGDLTIAGGAQVSWSGRGKIDFSAANVMRLLDAAGTAAPLVVWGQATASFPAIKRTSASISFRLADDSADAAISAAGVTASGNIIASGATSTIRLKGYTVATLPAGTVGDTAYVTDALAPAYGAAVAGTGAVVIPVFRNATTWICH